VKYSVQYYAKLAAIFEEKLAHFRANSGY